MVSDAVPWPIVELQLLPDLILDQLLIHLINGDYLARRGLDTQDAVGNTFMLQEGAEGAGLEHVGEYGDLLEDVHDFSGQLPDQGVVLEQIQAACLAQRLHILEPSLQLPTLVVMFPATETILCHRHHARLLEEKELPRTQV